MSKLNMNEHIICQTNYTYFNPYESSKRDIKFAILSDLHFAPSVTNEKLSKIIEHTKNMNPDYILFPGDLIDCKDSLDDYNELERIIAFVKELGKIAPTFIGLGNHDLIEKNKNRKSKEEHVWAYGYPKNFFDYLNELDNIHVLDNDMYENDEIQVLGITQSMEYCENPKNPKVEDKKEFIRNLKTNKNLLDRISNEKVTLTLTHSPVHVTDPDVIKYIFKTDYVVCGHMHTGCTPIFFRNLYHHFNINNGIIAPKKDLFPDNALGVKSLYVNWLDDYYYKDCLHKFLFIKKHSPNNTVKFGHSVGPYDLTAYELAFGKLIIGGGLTGIQDCVDSKVLHLGNSVLPMNITCLTLTKNLENDNQRSINYYR